MPRNYVKIGKKGKCFAVTINNVDWSKTLTGEWFKEDENICAICVAEENYHEPIDCETGAPSANVIGKHQHVYLEFSVGMYLNDVRELILTLTDDLGFDLQCCRKRRDWLIYITKEDYKPFMFNVRVSELSLYARSKQHFISKYKKAQPVDKADPFLFTVGNYRNIVMDVAEDHISKLRYEAAKQRVIRQPNMLCEITKCVINCLNNLRHVYIYGQPGVGKTELIDYYIKDKKVFRIGEKDRFMFGGMNDDVDLIVYDDFNPMEWEGQMKTILAIMDGKPVNISEKYKNDCVKFFHCQCIFLSNFPIPSCMGYLERRVEKICVSHKMFECSNCDFI